MLINPQQFIIKEVPKLHPLSSEYLIFWKDQYKKIIEGAWLGGYYMPPSLYFYVNFGTILLNKRNTNVKSLGRPLLRDLEWMFFQAWTEARGFSGFKEDEEFSGDHILLDGYPIEYLKEFHPHVINSAGKVKEYRDPRTLLTMKHDYHKGAPLWTNEAKNIMMLGSRDTGKTYMVSQGVVLHQWLTNGVLGVNEKVDRAVDMTVGAELAAYSKNMLVKTKLAFENLAGAIEIDGSYYPSPLSQQYKGSWEPGSEIIAQYKKKVSGGWKVVGSRATIRHRTFRDNPFADQGTRPVTIIVEEAGMCSNLMDIFSNTKDNLMDGTRKIGTLMMLGTGGDMESGTVDASQMFYEPEAFQMLSFEDKWEEHGKIGFFIPAYVALNQFKDEKGFSREEEARTHLLKKREQLKNARGGSEAYNKEIQYRPIKPSEMFLTKQSNIFPVQEIRERLSKLNNDYEYLEKKAVLYFDPKSEYGGVNYRIDPEAVAITQHPWTKDEIEGSLILYELPYLGPDGKTPDGAYIIGCDPFRDNVSSNGTGSFAAIYVIKTNKYPTTVGFSEVVAAYVGRPYMGVNVVNELLHKLALFYNAKIYFENAVGNVKDYFDKNKRLDLLATQPVNLLNKKASYNVTDPLIYGYPMSNEKIKWELLQYVRSWLLEERGDGKRNVDLIPDRFLLQQLASFNLKGNFDAVMGFVGCVVGLQETHISAVRKLERETNLSPLKQEFEKILVHNKRLFKV